MTGTRVWWYFVAFFGFIVAVNALMATLAIRTHSGVVTDHAYEKGLAYNRVVEAETKQEALGWQGTIDYQNGALRFTLRDRDQNMLTPDHITASFTRPTQSGLDFNVALKGAETPVVFPARGVWDVRINAQAGDENYQQTKRIVVK
jgi:nitrogen fixation protein FixH